MTACVTCNLVPLQEFGGIETMSETCTINLKQWRLVRQLLAAIDMLKLVSAMAVFVRKQRLILADSLSFLLNQYHCDLDLFWANELFVCVHRSITCWIQDGIDALDMKKQVEEKVCYKPNWQNQISHWRRDYVWVQKPTKSKSILGNACNNKLVGQMQLILNIIDLNALDSKGKPVKYNSALLKLLWTQNKEIPSKITDMVELQLWPMRMVQNPWTLRALKMFDMSSIVRSVHMMPNRKSRFYVNNYSDWNTYNSIYNEVFLENGKRRADQYRKDWSRQSSWGKLIEAGTCLLGRDWVGTHQLSRAQNRIRPTSKRWTCPLSIKLT